LSLLALVAVLGVTAAAVVVVLVVIKQRQATQFLPALH
jgi:hypothetical protein